MFEQVFGEDMGQMVLKEIRKPERLSDQLEKVRWHLH